MSLLRNRLVVVLVAGLVLLAVWFLWFREPATVEPDPALVTKFWQRVQSGHEGVIVFQGDSITAGTNAPQSFVTYLQERFDHIVPGRVRCINAGVPGARASDGLARLSSDVYHHNPDLVLVEFGWNDFKDGVSADDFESTLRTLVERLQQNTSAVVFLATTTHVNVAMANWKIRPRNEIIREVAVEKGCGLVDVYAGFKRARKQGARLEDLMSSDRIHPALAGHQLIADLVWAHLQPPGGGTQNP